MASWSTVTTAKEPTANLQAFVAWHLAIGASEILIYLDDPADTAPASFTHLPQVKFIRCDQPYWDTYNAPRPTGIRKRQIFNATNAYYMATSEWILHVDIDEFVYMNGCINTFLQNLPSENNQISMRPVERIFMPDEVNQPYTDIFRVAVEQKTPKWLSKIYANPEQMPYGFMGHINGKTFVRTGLSAVNIQVHRVEIDGEIPAPNYCTNMHLLHLYSFGLEHFIAKGAWKFARQQWRKDRDNAASTLSLRDRRRQIIGMVFESEDQLAKNAYFADAFVFDAKRLRKLCRYQRVQKFNFNAQLQVYLQKYFG